MRASKNSLSPTIQMGSSGFTLIELMVTIAVLAIIVGIAAPSISTQLANQRVKATANTLANALKEAKVESILRRQNIELAYDPPTSKTIKLKVGSTEISSYKINDKSKVTRVITPATESKVIFQPNKKIAKNVTVVYTICDEGSKSVAPKQVSLTSIANINTTNAGSC
ncbi:Tfp pilus assembly protein FimT/FimU [Psychrobacter sp. Rd 27.2]|uniref:pilus assembly FimT family protein n=1 Tax=Psychrobacter sp. Rd 27.2 TaxID=1926479 RepID=UPI000AC1FBBB|nr:prepilin-type N-terminal cleavage/methylation domain-containing protein [Psychrobacter sp. Rd 27.2]